MKKLVTALIGFGLSGKYIQMPSLVKNENYVLKYIMTTNQESIDYIHQEFKNITIISDYMTAIQDDLVDLVIIATPNVYHEPYTLLALNHHKHVLVEKPFVESYEKAKALFDLAKQKKLVLRVFHNRKYDGEIITVKNLIDQNRLGNIIHAEFRFDYYEPIANKRWRNKISLMSGVYFDLAPHLVHHAIYFFGLPNKVKNTLYKDRDQVEVDDHFEMDLYYDHFIIHLGSELNNQELKPRFHIKGTLFEYIKKGFDHPEFIHKKPEFMKFSQNNDSYLIDHQSNRIFVPVELGCHYQLFDKLYDDIINYKLVDEDDELALKTVYVIEKGLISHQNNKIVDL
jgi:scyllo-inositol 2-dehydrogenase (NADP+)